MSSEPVPEPVKEAGGHAVNGAPPRWREPATAILVGALVLLASLSNYLSHNDYALLRPEVGLLAALFILIAVGVGLLYTLMGSLGRMLLELVLVFLALDINFGLTAAVIGTPVIGLLLRRRMLPFLGIVAAVVLVTSIAGLGSFDPSGDPSNEAGKAPSARPSDAPVLVHLILDEHIGVEGILGDAPENAAMREGLKSFYVGNGFRLIGGAYSEYLHTLNAIPQILNLGIQQEPMTSGVAMESNAYFDGLAARGYRIRVYQTDFLDYCGNAAVVFCKTRRAADANDILDTKLATTDKVRLLFNETVLLSRFAQGLVNLYNLAGGTARLAGLLIPPYQPNLDRMPNATGALETYDLLIRDLRRAQPGDAFFVHEIIPHYPYVVDARCALRPAEEWLNRAERDVGIAERQRAYFAQIGCMMTKLKGVLDALAKSPVAGNYIMVVHGDHGSRITEVDPGTETLGRFSDADMIAGHSTLFAVRAPAIASGYSTERAPAALLLKTLAQSDFRSVDLPEARDMAHRVILEDSGWLPVAPHDLPGWWVEQK